MRIPYFLCLFLFCKIEIEHASDKPKTESEEKFIIEFLQEKTEKGEPKTVQLTQEQILGLPALRGLLTVEPQTNTNKLVIKEKYIKSDVVNTFAQLDTAIKIQKI